ncbi:MarR family winged helix-turn-helix transcriptional regulator [Paenibacillus sediminis]|uniref:DNA-binding MarR family transcriptional regulator n=1 Tax=Paenibacillus sediminis TaxID=664909 RepID=A0ABS4H3Y3_9BACL|nr:MarR family transcriptional regulator [Paenibacillus sediminis]MBP1937223.1 DNA-binding MarR family transcriptional regulator [Paenibacillus sediminis]
MTEFKELGVTLPQIKMLHMIEHYGTSKLSVLAEQLEVKPSAITVMIDRLEASGFVKRHADEQDRRVVLVSITDAGREVLEEARRKTNQVLADYFSELEHEELEQLIILNEKLASIAQKRKESSCSHHHN